MEAIPKLAQGGIVKPGTLFIGGCDYSIEGKFLASTNIPSQEKLNQHIVDAVSKSIADGICNTEVRIDGKSFTI